MRDRLPVALFVAVVGTAVFIAMRAVLVGLLDPFAYVGACFLGSLGSSLIFLPGRPMDFSSALARAIPIVALTYLAIAGGHLLEVLGQGNHRGPEQALSLLFWAVVTTAWWLPFGAAATILVATRLVHGSYAAFLERDAAHHKWRPASAEKRRSSPLTGVETRGDGAPAESMRSRPRVLVWAAGLAGVAMIPAVLAVSSLRPWKAALSPDGSVVILAVIEDEAAIDEASWERSYAGVEWRWEGRAHRILPIRLSDAGLELGEELALAVDEPRISACCYWLSVDGEDLYVATPRGVERRRPFDAEFQTVSVPTSRRPTALSCRDASCLVGSVGQVSVIDFGSDAAIERVLYRDPEVNPSERWAKPVDYFVRSSQVLLAVDDVVDPKWVYVFEVGKGRPPTFREKARLPERANQIYRDGVATHRGFYLASTAYSGSGTGSDLYRATWNGTRLRVSRDLLYPPYDNGYSLASESGWDLTYTRGLGVLGNRLVTGMGPRGVVSFGLGPLLVAHEHARPSPVLDLHVAGGRVVTLEVRDATDEEKALKGPGWSGVLPPLAESSSHVVQDLVVLTLEDGDLVERARHPLRRKYTDLHR